MLPSPEETAAEFPRFDTFWYQGQAELTRYVLRQSRYGELHDGEAVLVFVTEDFLPKRQVKQERGESALKVSSTIQEWCGQVYTQINRRDGQLRVRPRPSARFPR